MMKSLLQRPLFIFDILLIASVIGGSYLGKHYPHYIQMWTLMPIVGLALIWKLKIVDKTYLSFVAMALPYLAYSQFLILFNNGLLPGIDPKEGHFMLDKLYPMAITILLVGTLRIYNAVDLFKALRIALPPTTALVFALLTYDMFKSSTDVCRILGLTFLPFTPALFFSSVTILSFVGWSRLNRIERLYRYILVSMSIVVVLAYTGSRGIALAFAVCLGAIILFTLLWRRGREQPKPLLLIVSVLFGVLLCAVVEAITGCAVFMRFIGTLDVLKFFFPNDSVNTVGSIVLSGPSEAVAILVANTSGETGQSTLNLAKSTSHTSIFLRLYFWELGWESIKAAPWLGHGIFYEQTLLFKNFGHTHVHNQYLSWLIWGGIPALCLGLSFLFAVVPFALRAPKFDALVIILATSAMMALSVVVDSFLRIDTYVFMHIMLALVGLGLSTQLAKEARNVATEDA